MAILGAMTAPDDTQEHPVVRAEAPSLAICTVAMGFHGDVATAEYNRYLDAPWEGFDVLDDAPTTTAPSPTPTTTSTSGASAGA
jgi:hypothetical protein